MGRIILTHRVVWMKGNKKSKTFSAWRRVGIHFILPVMT